MRDLLGIIGTLGLLGIASSGSYLIGKTVGWEAHRRSDECPQIIEDAGTHGTHMGQLNIECEKPGDVVWCQAYELPEPGMFGRCATKWMCTGPPVDPDSNSLGLDPNLEIKPHAQNTR
jgi:hypothetical protein